MRQSLEALRKVIIGVVKEGKYLFLMGDPYVKQAVEACYKAGVHIYDVKRTIDEAYKEAKDEFSKVSARRAEEDC